MKQNKVPKNEYTNGEPSPYRKNPFKKDVFYGDDGQYAYPGQVTRIPGDAFGTHITMKGINEPLYARDDQGNEQMMQPGEDYTFPGQYVTEYPQIQTAQYGKQFNTYEADLISKVLMNRNRDKDFVQRAYALGQNPNMFSVPDPDQFGSNMSHKMEWGEDDSGQAWMYPSIMNPKNEAIKVPNQYADYISSEGYKKATGMPVEKNGGWLDELEQAQDGKEAKLKNIKQLYNPLEEKYYQLLGDPKAYEKNGEKNLDFLGNWLMRVLDTEDLTKRNPHPYTQEIKDLQVKLITTPTNELSNFIQNADLNQKGLGQLKNLPYIPKSWNKSDIFKYMNYFKQNKDKGYTYKNGGGLLNKTLTCSSCGWSWKAVDGGKDIATCHKCGGTAKLAYGGIPMAQAGYNLTAEEAEYLKNNPLYEGDSAIIDDGIEVTTGPNNSIGSLKRINPNWKVENTSRFTELPMEGKAYESAQKFLENLIKEKYQENLVEKLNRDVTNYTPSDNFKQYINTLNERKKKGENLDGYDSIYHHMIDNTQGQPLSKYMIENYQGYHPAALAEYLQKEYFNKKYGGGLYKQSYGGDPSLPNIEGHYPFGGQNSKTGTHFQEGGWLDELQKGGDHRIVIPKDEYNMRSDAERDSLNTFYYTDDILNGIKYGPGNIDLLKKSRAKLLDGTSNIKPVSYKQVIENGIKYNIPIYKKPTVNVYEKYKRAKGIGESISGWLNETLGPPPQIGVLDDLRSGSRKAWTYFFGSDDDDDKRVALTNTPVTSQVIRSAQPKPVVKLVQPSILKEPGKSQPVKSKVIKPSMTKDNSRRLMTGEDWQDVNSNDYGAEEAKIRSADPEKFDIYRLPNNKFELVPKTKKQAQIVKPKEVITPDYLPMIQTGMPEMAFREPELRISSTPKDTTAGKRIAWRQDPNTKKMVPVIGGMKEKVADMKRLYNKDIPSSTGAIPADFIPDYGDVVTFQNGGWLDAYDEEYRRGGMVNPLMKARSKRSGTSKNIQSSINKLFLRNKDLFGPGGKNIYNPKSKYQDGGLSDAEANYLNRKAYEESLAQARKDYINDFVKQGTKQALLESPFNLAAGFTPAGAAMFAGQSAASALQNTSQGDYLSAGLDAAFALPLLKPLKQIKALKGLPKGAKAVEALKKTSSAIPKTKTSLLETEKYLAKDFQPEGKYYITRTGMYDKPSDPNYLHDFKVYKNSNFLQHLPSNKYGGQQKGWLDNLH